jgi:DNA-binding transcriptional LysR family regulator
MFKDLNDIRLFASVARHTSITRGAQALQMPAATVSRRLTALERELGQRLVERSSRRFVLTETGQAYYTAATRVLDDLQQASTQMAGLTRSPAGHVRMAAPPDFASFFLAPALAYFSMRYPDISLALDLSPRRVDLVDDGFDVVLRMSALDDSRWVSRKLTTLTRSVYASKSCAKRHPAPQTPEDLATCRRVSLAAGAEAGEWVLQRNDRPSVKRSVNAPAPISVNSVALLRQLVVAGAGFGLVPDALMAADLKAGRVLAVLPGWQAPPVDAHLLFRARALLPQRVRLLVDHLLAAFAP